MQHHEIFSCPCGGLDFIVWPDQEGLAHLVCSSCFRRLRPLTDEERDFLNAKDEIAIHQKNTFREILGK